VFGGEVQRLAAGGEHRQARAGDEDLGQQRGRIEHLLEVVEQHEPSPCSHDRSKLGGQGPVPARADPHRPGDGGADEVRVGDRGERHEAGVTVEA